MERAADCRRQKPGAYPDRSGRVAQPVTENDRKVAGANTAAFCDRKPTTAACHMDGRQLTNQGLCDEQRLSRPYPQGDSVKVSGASKRLRPPLMSMHDGDNLNVLIDAVWNYVGNIREHHFTGALDAAGTSRRRKVRQYVSSRHNPRDNTRSSVWIVFLDILTNLIKPPQRSQRPADAFPTHD